MEICFFAGAQAAHVLLSLVIPEESLDQTSQCLHLASQADSDVMNH